MMYRGQAEGEFRYVQIEEEDRLIIVDIVSRKQSIKDILSVMMDMQQKANKSEGEWWAKMTTKYDLPVALMPNGGLLVSPVTGLIHRKGWVNQAELDELTIKIMKQQKEKVSDGKEESSST